ncbi:hypothetical protein HMPREF9418_1345 [Neisseria macacae ATCC 33926]|uniref:Uncharacterized protein n=1 Tax=Neisseria macacae ATCC 33926 TaxID=997348 RepID=A0AA36UJJ0_9NEIS|nr:hypothetical protein HMPREF9418_1345 [Neisseria macacae ATCC 33926]
MRHAVNRAKHSCVEQAFLKKGRLKNEFRCFQTTFGVLISVKHC